MMHFDAQFFERHQEVLLKIANNPALRWLLGLNRLPPGLADWEIGRITPFSIHKINGVEFYKGEIAEVNASSACYLKNKFADALAYNLSPFAYFQPIKGMRFSPVGALYAASLGIISAKTMGLPLLFSGTLSSNLPTAAGDGCATLYNQATWAAAHDGSAANYYNYTNTYMEDPAMSPGHIRHSSGNKSLGRGFLPFNTNIGSVTKNSANVYLCTNYKANSGGGSGYFNLVGTTQESVTYVEADDYSRVGSTRFSTDVDLVSLATAGNWQTWALNASGISAIDTGGYTKLGLRMACDIDNSDPSFPLNSNCLYCVYTSEDTSGTKDPYMVIDYTASGGFVRRGRFLAFYQ